MDKLAGVDAEALRETLRNVDEAKPAKRLMVALAYKDGVAVDTLSARYGIPRSTIYYWLDRLEGGLSEDALRDGDRPGRPSKLDAEHWDRLRSLLDESPREHGFDESEWTPAALRRFIERKFAVTYSLGHVRRLLRELQ